jgi:hypothetical protein
MRSFWSEPFLWIHLAGLAAFPIFLEITWLGLAVGDPLLPVWLEILLVAAAGIIPILWMQLFRPFCIFSIVAVSAKPEKLSDRQRKILTLFKSSSNQIVAVVAAVFLFWVLWQIYFAAPVVATTAAFLPQWRILGLFLAAGAFLASNLFLQVPLSVGRVLLVKESEFAAAEAYTSEKISQNFTLPGWQVEQILPLMILEAEGSASQKELPN